ncbi:MAG: hypothetical protein LBJ46_06015 [Planctomycetota bacterium]|jgi:hypothetical protein|nr:hypothetical protein [Planctomycetota bacterium]
MKNKRDQGKCEANEKQKETKWMIESGMEIGYSSSWKHKVIIDRRGKTL